MTHRELRYLARRTASDKKLRDKAFNIAKIPKYDGYQRGLPAMVYKLFGNKTSGSSINNENMLGQQLAEEIHKPIIRKFKKRRLTSPFIENIWGVDLADMQLISKFNKGFRFLLCVIDIHSKHTWIILLKVRKAITKAILFRRFQKNLIENQTK